MRILVTFAVEAEFTPWRRRHFFNLTSMPAPVGPQNYEFYRGTVFENSVDVLLTGVGWEESKGANRPRFVLRELLRQRPDICISTGLAGGLKADIKCEEIVAAAEVLLRKGGDVMRSSPKLLAIAKESGARVERKQITETRVVSEVSAKAALSEFGDLVDMEGYYILQIVSGTRIPVISVRAVSDTVTQELPREIGSVVDREGRVQKAPLFKMLLKSPAKIPSLISLGVHSKRAAEKLADFLDRFLESVGGHDSVARANRMAVAAR